MTQAVNESRMDFNPVFWLQIFLNVTTKLVTFICRFKTCKVLYTFYLIWSSQQLWQVGAIIIPILKMRFTTCSNLPSKWLRQNMTSGFANSRFSTLSLPHINTDKNSRWWEVIQYQDSTHFKGLHYFNLSICRHNAYTHEHPCIYYQ